MYKYIAFFVFFILLNSFNCVFSEEDPKLNFNELLDNNSLVSKHLTEHTPYNAIPGNLDDLYSDVNKKHWSYKALMELSKKYNVLEGMPDKEYQGDRPATRYEMAQALAKLLNTITKEHVELSSIEEAALDNLKREFENEIVALAAKVEINTQNIEAVDQKHTQSTQCLANEVKAIKERFHFDPRLRLRYRWGDPETFTSGRVRLTSKTWITDRTYVRLRLEGRTVNMINDSEREGAVTDADLTLGFVETGDLTRWIPEKLGRLNLLGGIIHTNRIMARRYRVCVDQRGFSDVVMAVSPYNSQFLSLNYELASGRRMGVGGEYIKVFKKYNGLIKAGGLRTTGGSYAIPGTDISASGRESTHYSVMGQMDLPVNGQPVELKVSHSYSINDNQSSLDSYTVGGRIATKFDGIGVFKAALIRFGGSTPVRYIGGRGGHGFSYQFAYNPAIRAFGDLFGDPDKITHDVYDVQPGKTEIGFAFADLHNDTGIDLRVLDIFASRYITKNVWGLIRYTHANPNSRLFGLSARNSIELQTVFKF